MSTDTPSTDTPRTDAAIADYQFSTDPKLSPLATPRTDSAAAFKSFSGGLVTADFARTLERELAEANEACRKGSEDALLMRDDLLKQLAEARAEVERFKEGLANIEELHATKSKMEVHIKQHPALRELVARTFASMVADSPNYTEAKFDIRGTHNWITVTVQKANGKTPHQKRVEAESERDELKRKVAELEQDKARIDLIETGVSVLAFHNPDGTRFTAEYENQDYGDYPTARAALDARLDAAREKGTQ